MMFYSDYESKYETDSIEEFTSGEESSENNSGSESESESESKEKMIRDFLL